MEIRLHVAVEGQAAAQNYGPMQSILEGIWNCFQISTPD